MFAAPIVHGKTFVCIHTYGRTSEQNLLKRNELLQIRNCVVFQLQPLLLFLFFSNAEAAAATATAS